MFLFTLVTSISFVLQIRADDSDNLNYFNNPPGPGPKYQFQHDNVWTIGTPVTLNWATSYNNLSLYLWQYGNSTKQTLLDNVGKRTSWPWKVNLEGLFSLSDGDVFQFEVNDTSPDAATAQTKQSFLSHYINITNSNASPSSSISVSASPTSSSSTSAATSSANSTSPASSTGLLTGARIGIGVGVGGVVLLILIGAFFFFRRRIMRAREQSHNKPYTGSQHLQSPTPMYPPSAGGMAQMNGMSPHYASQTPKSPQEMPDDSMVSELAAVRGRQERQELPGDLHGRGHFAHHGSRK